MQNDISCQRKWQENEGSNTLLDKIDTKKVVTKSKEVHYWMINASKQEENITLFNIYSPNTRTCKYSKQILTDI